jgi:hypothetical protein
MIFGVHSLYSWISLCNRMNSLNLARNHQKCTDISKWCKIGRDFDSHPVSSLTLINTQILQWC